MLYSRLSILDDFVNEDTKNNLHQYFQSLVGGALTNITVSKLSKALKIDSRLAQEILFRCTENNILKQKYALRCSECGMLIKKFDLLAELPEEPIVCYACDEMTDVSLENIEVVYEVQDKSFFEIGQRSNKVYNVALEDSVYALLQTGNIHELFYNPTEEDYRILEEMCLKIMGKSKTTKEKGDTLESFVNELFSKCKVLKTTTKMTTETNQIDCFVVNKNFVPYGIFNTLGGRFIIECKNEERTPRGEYMSKIHSIITNANAGGKNDFIKFGIIISKEKGPKTFDKLSHDYYLSNNIIIISICLDELKEMLDAKNNLLDLIEEKATKVVLNSKKTFQEMGLT